MILAVSLVIDGVTGFPKFEKVLQLLSPKVELTILLVMLSALELYAPTPIALPTLGVSRPLLKALLIENSLAATVLLLISATPVTAMPVDASPRN